MRYNGDHGAMQIDTSSSAIVFRFYRRTGALIDSLTPFPRLPSKGVKLIILRITVGVQKHFDPPIIEQINAHILKDRPCVAVFQIAHAHLNGLFIELPGDCGSHITVSPYAGRWPDGRKSSRSKICAPGGW